jgi:sugar transferase EpsL
MKRMFDFVVAFMLIMLLWPIMMIIVILIRIKLGSPILFKQQRPGMHGKPFIIYKFRTMKQLADKNGKLLDDSLRMTGLGTFLRKYSLDELPQLFNILKGDLSLIGPRPLLMEYLPLYSKEQTRRHDVRPGISGWAQVNGRNAVSWEEKFQYDVWYVDNQSFLLDMKIMWMTLIKVISSEGVTQEGSVTMEKFRGEADNTRRSND